jgi:uncharacterized protein (DUF2252 family)
MSKISDSLKAFNANRLPEMIQLKYEGMAENVFRFFRGTCHIFSENISKVKDLPESPPTWVCGDLHIENFGSYKADNKVVYFDLNDFDEAIRAPALWEVIRTVTSIFLAFYTLEIEQDQAINMVGLFLKSYASTLSKGKALCIEPRTCKGIVCQFLKNATKSGYTDLLLKRTITRKDKIRISLSDERHFKIEKTIKKELMAHVQKWIKTSNDGPYNYEVKDAVFRLAGTGSIGVKRYLFLLKSTNTKNQFLLVDMKQSFPSALQPYIRLKQPDWETEAHRIISIQQRMQNMSASLLSATVFKGEPYVIQELQPVKDTLKFKLIKDNYKDMYQVIDDMAILTASSQLRSGGMGGSATIDDLMKFADRKDWQEEVLTFALNYSNVVKRDYKQFLKDYKRGVFK